MKFPLRLALALAALLCGGGARADLKEGALAYRIGDYAAAIPQVKPLAEAGNATAQYLLGSALANAKAPLLDLAAAEGWLRKAADQGNLAAMRDLGMLNLYYKKPGDVEQALRWLRAAADRGDTEAEHQLGILLLGGEVVAKDHVQGYKWLLLAAERGHLLSAVMVETLRDSLAETELTQAARLAREWKPVR